MNLPQAVDLRIGELCKEHGITRYQLAKKYGMYTSTLASIKNCKTVKLDTIWAICEAFDMELEEFFASDIFKRNHIINKY